MCKYVLENGEDRSDRTGTGTRSVFGYQTRYDLRDGFPLMTTKKMFIRPIAEELLWFIKGDTNIKYLVDRNVKIWNEWPYENYKKSKDYQGETLIGNNQKGYGLILVDGYPLSFYKESNNQVKNLYPKGLRR